jgi:hypothetical protein
MTAMMEDDLERVVGVIRRMNGIGTEGEDKRNNLLVKAQSIRKVLSANLKF